MLYTQYPGQKEPDSIMNCHNGVWVDVSPTYSNLFFRVVGNKTAAFGSVQSESVPSIDQIKRAEQHQSGYPEYKTYELKSNWTNLEWFSQYYRSDARNYGLSLHKTNVENRPRNMAVKIWKCVKN